MLKVSYKGQEMKKITKDQGGVVSILVTVVFILLISMIVLAMAENSNREQRQSLDRQLSDQAFYNAESGISDWAEYLTSGRTTEKSKTVCDTSAFPDDAPKGPIDGGVNSYSCVLFNREPSSLEIKPLSTDENKSYPIKSTVPITSLKFTWNANPGGNQVGGCAGTGSGLPSSLGANCNVGGVRFELFRLGANREQTIKSTYIGYFLPRNGGVGGSLNVGSLAYPDNQGMITPGGCSDALGGCVVTLTGLNILPTDNWTLNVKSLYTDNRVTVVANNGTVGFVDAQIEIDSTGKANDVLRRIKVRLPASLQYTTPGTGGSDVLATKESICKLIDVNQAQSSASFTDASCAD